MLLMENNEMSYAHAARISENRDDPDHLQSETSSDPLSTIFGQFRDQPLTKPTSRNTTETTIASESVNNPNSASQWIPPASYSSDTTKLGGRLAAASLYSSPHDLNPNLQSQQPQQQRQQQQQQQSEQSEHLQHQHHEHHDLLSNHHHHHRQQMASLYAQQSRRLPLSLHGHPAANEQSVTHGPPLLSMFSDTDHSVPDLHAQTNTPFEQPVDHLLNYELQRSLTNTKKRSPPTNNIDLDIVDVNGPPIDDEHDIVSHQMHLLPPQNLNVTPEDKLAKQQHNLKQPRYHHQQLQQRPHHPHHPEPHQHQHTTLDHDHAHDARSHDEHQHQHRNRSRHSPPHSRLEDRHSQLQHTPLPSAHFDKQPQLISTASSAASTLSASTISSLSLASRHSSLSPPKKRRRSSQYSSDSVPASLGASIPPTSTATSMKSHRRTVSDPSEIESKYMPSPTSSASMSSASSSTTTPSTTPTFPRRAGSSVSSALLKKSLSSSSSLLHSSTSSSSSASASSTKKKTASKSTTTSSFGKSAAKQKKMTAKELAESEKMRKLEGNRRAAKRFRLKQKQRELDMQQLSVHLENINARLLLELSLIEQVKSEQKRQQQKKNQHHEQRR